MSHSGKATPCWQSRFFPLVAHPAKIRTIFHKQRVAEFSRHLHHRGMSAVSNLANFHHWLLDGKPEALAYPQVIVLHGASQYPQLSTAIAHYLNEYDDQANGHWICSNAELIEAIAADPMQRKLLGIDQTCEKCPPTGPCGLRKVIKGMAQRGHVIIESIHAAAATEGLDGVFHVSLSKGPKDFHVHLNAERFDERCRSNENSCAEDQHPC
ncbi:MAG: hypothetical protein EAZ81_10660 [Verrucomicrobia bacterium]|nr:MAG: hypothetical protein EAZ81_10660 [Verrucomicrobiota bacterium]